MLFRSPAPAGTPLTVGEKLYLRYGIRGVRGQAEDGFPAVLHAGLPVLEKELAAGADINRAGSVAMLAILCADTDIDRQTYEHLRNRSVREVLETNGELKFEDALQFQRGIQV